MTLVSMLSVEPSGDSDAASAAIAERCHAGSRGFQPPGPRPNGSRRGATLVAPRVAGTGGNRRSATSRNARCPGVETPGYRQASLRDGTGAGASPASARFLSPRSQTLRLCENAALVCGKRRTRGRVGVPPAPAGILPVEWAKRQRAVSGGAPPRLRPLSGRMPSRAGGTPTLPRGLRFVRTSARFHTFSLFGNALWSETPFRMEGVSAGGERADLTGRRELVDDALAESSSEMRCSVDSRAPHPQTPPPCETEFRSKVRSQTGVWERGNYAGGCVAALRSRLPTHFRWPAVNPRLIRTNVKPR